MAEVRIHPENSGSAGRNNHVMAPKKIHINLETQVLIGLVLGLAAGVFFGDMVAFTRIAGDAFIKLLQVTVIPYIIVSLITALGRLSYDEVNLWVSRPAGFYSSFGGWVLWLSFWRRSVFQIGRHPASSAPAWSKR